MGLGTLLGCGSPFSPVAHVTGCPDGTAVQVRTGVAPRFTWGGCKVAAVSVEPVDAQGVAIGNTVWGVVGELDGHGVHNNVIESGVTYGEEPRLATTTVAASPLQTGQRYRVLIWTTGPASQFGYVGGGSGFFVQ